MQTAPDGQCNTTREDMRTGTSWQGGLAQPGKEIEGRLDTYRGGLESETGEGEVGEDRSEVRDHDGDGMRLLLSRRGVGIK